ncbi:glycosyltransferase family 2 protein [Phreatobacter sp.]|uniref:glycosyltransferase family 2 protein n=1 Tax=Phreatobacter sp. TaxID=1966341 RepID=UPI003F71E463
MERLDGIPATSARETLVAAGQRAFAADGALRLAIVITCYNYERFVGRCIESVLSQMRHDCQLLVIDDGSTDGSWEVISRSQAPAVKIANSGQRAACVKGLDLTCAPFILFLDADDELKPGALDAIVASLDPEVAKLQFALSRIDAEGNMISGAMPALAAFRSRADLLERVLRTGVYTTPPTSGNVLRRDVCEILREATYDRAVDGVVLFAAPLFGDVVSLSEEWGRYRIHGGNDSGLGRPLDPLSLERDILRFADRMDHLRAVVGRLLPGREMIRPQDSFFYRERSLCLDIVSGQRPSRTRLAGLLKALWSDYYSRREKAGMSLFYVVATLLPPARARALMSYRFNPHRRTALGFLRVALKGSL